MNRVIDLCTTSLDPEYKGHKSDPDLADFNWVLPIRTYTQRHFVLKWMMIFYLCYWVEYKPCNKTSAYLVYTITLKIRDQVPSPRTFLPRERSFPEYVPSPDWTNDWQVTYKSQTSLTRGALSHGGDPMHSSRVGPHRSFQFTHHTLTPFSPFVRIHGRRDGGKALAPPPGFWKYVDFSPGSFKMHHFTTHF